MSPILVQLRWSDPGPERYDETVRAIPQVGDLPAGCLSRQLRRQGGRTDGHRGMGRRNHRRSDGPPGHGDAGRRVEDSPQTGMFSMPAMYAAVYRRPARAATGDATAAIPAQRGAPARDLLLAGADAPAPVSG